MAVFFAAASELATLTNTFTVTSGGVATPTDPSTITLTITTPAGIATSYTFAGGGVTKDSVGVYHKDVDVSSESGTWQYEWIGTGSATDHETGTFDVQPNELGHLYATPRQLKNRLQITNTTTDDEEVYAACFAASRHVEQECGRVFWRTASASARLFNPRDYYCLDVDDIATSTGVVVKGDYDNDGVFEVTWASTDYQLLPVDPGNLTETRPYTAIRAVGTQIFPWVYGYFPMLRDGGAQITATWGWPAVPRAVANATLIKAAELFKLKDAPFGVAGFGDLGVVRVRDNPVVEGLLREYRRGTKVGFA